MAVALTESNFVDRSTTMSFIMKVDAFAPRPITQEAYKEGGLTLLDPDGLTYRSGIGVLS